MGTYGDMVTLLLCFFVLLFSMSSVDVRKFKEAIASFNEQIDILPGGEALSDGERINNGVTQMAEIEILIDKALEQNEEGKEGEKESDAELTEEELMKASLEQAKEVYDNVDQYLQDQGIREEVEMKYSLNYVKITLPGETLFDSGQASIKAQGFPVIDGLGDMIQDQRFSEYTVQIEGHTDNIPINTVYFPSNWELSAARAIAVGKYIIDQKGFDESKMACTGYGEYRPLVDNDSPENRAINRRVEVKIILQSVEVDVSEYDQDNEPDLGIEETTEDVRLEDMDPEEAGASILEEIMNDVQPLE